jgi:hypothetical protein
MRHFSTVVSLPWLARACLIIVIVSVVTVSLVPAGFGPYSAVNGPATVFKSIQQADALKAAVSSNVLLTIRLLVSMIHSPRIATSSAPGSEWIDILERYCVHLC